MPASPSPIPIRLSQDARHALSRDPARTLEEVQQSVDALADPTTGASGGTLACRAGCDFCCHLRIMATPAEVFALFDYQFRHLSPLALQRFEQRVIETDRRLRRLKGHRVLTTKLPCPALEHGRCSVYPARPLGCRAHHSLSRTTCQAAFNKPDDLTLEPPQHAALAEAYARGLTGFQDACEEAELDSRHYELASALAEAFADPDCRRRFADGETAFQRPVVFPPGGG